jgi:hypothetical protein
MYTIFIIFFASLLGIMIVLGRKVVLIRAGGASFDTQFHPLLPDLIKIKTWTLSGLKTVSYAVVVIYLRIYFRLINFLKMNNFF